MTIATLLQRLLRHPFIRFALVGGAGYLVNAAALAFGSTVLHLPVEMGLAFAIFIAMCFTWLGNRYFTFRSRRARGWRGMAEEWLRFVGANLLGAVINYGVALTLVRYAPGLLSNRYVAQIFGVVAGLVFNFTLSRALVFRKSA